MKAAKPPLPVPVLLGGAAVLAYLLLGKQATATSVGVKIVPSSPPPKQTPPSNPQGIPAGLPPLPKVGVTALAPYKSPSFTPSDDLTPGGIVKAQVMTIRQIQTAMNILGASLKVNGCWDLPTQTALWDFQYLHAQDNPSDPLDVTGEMTQLTQTALANLVAKANGISGTFY
jgi:hypothetical protein